MIRDAKAPKYIPPPKKDDASVEEAARVEAESLRKRRGWRSTVATGPEGVTTPATTSKTLLGQ